MPLTPLLFLRKDQKLYIIFLKEFVTTTIKYPQVNTIINPLCFKIFSYYLAQDKCSILRETYVNQLKPRR